MTRILVTGANGFVGIALCQRLSAQGTAVTAAIRKQSSFKKPLPSMQTAEIGDIHVRTDWSQALVGATQVVHLAARVHVMRDQTRDPLAAFRAVNTAGTLNLARQAAAAGIKRFVYISTIKVNGEQTAERSFTVTDVPAPRDPYGISKWEAELGLRQLERETGLEVTVVRPPLVYGPGVKGNFFNLMRWIQRGLPLPLGACDNQRSLVGLDNLVDLLVHCVVDASAAGQTFMVSDGRDLTTSELVAGMARALGRPARLISVPKLLLASGARMLGKTDIYNRLCGSLQVNIDHTRQLLAWTPPVSVEAQLNRTAHWFLATHNQT